MSLTNGHARTRAICMPVHGKKPLPLLLNVVKPVFHYTDTKILAEILARIVARMSARCRATSPFSLLYRNNFRKSHVSDVRM